MHKYVHYDGIGIPYGNIRNMISLLKHDVDLNGRIHRSRRSFVISWITFVWITRYQRSFLNECNNPELLREDDEMRSKTGLFGVHEECM